MKKTCVSLGLVCFVLIGCHVMLFGQKVSKNAFSPNKENYNEYIRVNSFREHLEQLTKDPHPAGTIANERVRDYIEQVMSAAGLNVHLYPYDVMLPVEPGESILEIVSPIKITLNQYENAIESDPFSSHSGLTKGWNAWSGNGDVVGEVVYVNYGRREDFEYLREKGVSLKGKIAIARYGGNFRGYKAKFAQEAGAVGLIIYTDPGDSGYARGFVYPEGPYFSDQTIQRGSLLTLDYNGDALTPFEPALPLDGSKTISRLRTEDVAVHQIPVTPIGYASALEIFKLMEGRQSVPNGWQGHLPLTYRIEGGSQLKIRLKVEQPKPITRISNIVGSIQGKEFPDEWIILGCHYDAWTFGAADPNSGTALLLSMSETLGRMIKAGWRPSRSILLAHWDAEEHGLIGSSEWVEQFVDELKEKAVAYINLDAAVSGPRFSAAASPSLQNLVMTSTQKIQQIDDTSTVYDKWRQQSGGNSEPGIGSLGGGSDHVAFYMHAGVPSMNMGVGGKPYPYHSNYDNFHFYEKFIDSSFQYGPWMEKITAEVALGISETPVLAYHPYRYVEDFQKHFIGIKKELKSSRILSTIELPRTELAMQLLLEQKEAHEEMYRESISRLTSKNPIVPKLNDQLKLLERSFIKSDGMPFGSWYQSLYAVSDPYSGYSSWILPGFRFLLANNSVDSWVEWDEIYAEALMKLYKQIEKCESILFSK
jgi:N-acetylated-alpha-linked acidic dipeptidase